MNRQMVRLSRVGSMSNAIDDWVTIGVVVSKSDARTSAKVVLVEWCHCFAW